jgi:cellulose synthase/poly-beta-1,6-N-acetylglucosamine synthase-like glycosyltransferase
LTNYDYERFSRLAGPVTQPPDEGSYRIGFRKVMIGRDRREVMPLLGVTLVLSSLFFIWLVEPQHYPDNALLPPGVAFGNTVMFWLIVATEGIRLLNSATLCLSAAVMRDPIPVTAPAGLRVAFTTTIVPSREPLGVVRATLVAARAIRHEEPIDVWLLDEGNDPHVRAMCEELGVHHFSRAGVAEWNTTKGRFRAATKHGNHNSWLDAHGSGYDIVLSVDPDHVPLPDFAERLLGYFRDPDLAFVVGPQVYGNFDHYLPRSAEAQNSVFHSVVQRAANRFASAMFVGTNHAYRVAAWQGIDGFQDSITEDLATSLALHGTRNPATGARWKSVYTPDVLAVGEGPSTWSDFFNQQLRWARGSNEVAVTQAPRRLARLARWQRVYYLTLMAYYPTIAITWLLGTTLTLLYMALGSEGIVVHVSAWLALYVDVFVARLLLYFWLRRFNVSPHEPRGSMGMSGIFISILCTPVYSAALVGTVLRRRLRFMVTPKGQAASPDRLLTFRRHMFWAVISAAAIILAVSLGHVYPANLIWAVLSLVTCLAPIVLWAGERRLAPRRSAASALPPSAQLPLPRQSLEISAAASDAVTTEVVPAEVVPAEATSVVVVPVEGTTAQVDAAETAAAEALAAMVLAAEAAPAVAVAAEGLAAEAVTAANAAGEALTAADDAAAAGVERVVEFEAAT